MKNPISFFRK